ncbi:MAG: type IV pilus modification PilV family protein, partial [Acetivibrionales bacterium]
MDKKLKFHSNKGFSLIELLIAITILVIAATAVIPVLTFVTQANSQNKIRATGNSIAASIFEEISSMKYEDIGTHSGSPSGTVVTPRTVTVDGVDYQVDIHISWGSATDMGSSKKVNPVAFKNIRVIVKAKGAFTGTEDTIDKMYSIVAKEGQQSLPDKGNIRVSIKKADNEFFTTPSLMVQAAGPKTYNMPTEGGQVVFGEIDKGTYSVSAPIPGGYYVPQGETIESGNVVRKN